MQAYFFDKNMRYMYSHDGEYKDGSFVWRESSQVFPLSRLFYAEKHVACDTAKTIMIKQLNAYYRVEGSKITQLSFSMIDTKSAWVSDYINSIKMATLQEAMSLPKPTSILEQLKWIAILAVVILVVATLWASTNLWHTAQIALEPFNKTAVVCAGAFSNYNSIVPQLIHVLNQTQHFYASRGIT